MKATYVQSYHFPAIRQHPLISATVDFHGEQIDTPENHSVLFFKSARNYYINTAEMCVNYETLDDTMTSIYAYESCHQIIWTVALTSVDLMYDAVHNYIQTNSALLTENRIADMLKNVVSGTTAINMLKALRAKNEAANERERIALANQRKQSEREEHEKRIAELRRRLLEGDTLSCAEFIQAAKIAGLWQHVPTRTRGALTRWLFSISPRMWIYKARAGHRLNTSRPFMALCDDLLMWAEGNDQ